MRTLFTLMATAALPALAKDLDDKEPQRVKASITRIDALIAAARTNAEAAGARECGAAAAVATQAARAQADAADARRQLAELQMKQTAPGATLVLQEVVFQTGRAELKPGAEARLQPLARYLRANPNVKVRLDGHTDAQGADAFNQRLSQARAASVRAALAAMGVDGGRIEAIGHGEAQPVADNRTEAGRQQSRRVEITLVGQQVGEAVASR